MPAGGTRSVGHELETQFLSARRLSPALLRSRVPGFALQCRCMASAAPGDTELISVAATTSEAAGDSYLFNINESVSADGRFVTFVADASNLVPDDSGLAMDVFVRDRLSNQTQRVSVSSSGAEGNDGSDQPCI